MQTTGFSMFVDGGRGMRVGSDGSGLANVWRQQLMQFKNVSVEVSNAVIAQYPSPQLLHDVWFSCHYCLIVVQFFTVEECFEMMNTSLIRLATVPYHHHSSVWEQIFWLSSEESPLVGALYPRGFEKLQVLMKSDCICQDYETYCPNVLFWNTWSKITKKKSALLGLYH